MSLYRNLVIAVFAAGMLAAGPAEGRELKKGDMLLSVGGGLSKDSFSIGGTFGYFFSPRWLLGTSYFFTLENDSYLTTTDEGSLVSEDISIQYHDWNLFGRFYLITKGSIFPFLYGGGGYLHYGYSGDSVPTRSYDLWSLAGGAGVMASIARHFGVELTVGVREYVAVPAELDDASFDSTVFEWRVGFGFYL